MKLIYVLEQRSPTFLALVSWKTIFPWMGVGDGSGGNASDEEQWGAMGSDGERQMKLRSLAHPLLTSCCVAWFITGRGLVLVRGLGVEDPCSREYSFLKFIFY